MRERDCPQYSSRCPDSLAGAVQAPAVWLGRLSISSIPNSLSCALAAHVGEFSAMDSCICQTLTASPGRAGGGSLHTS
jgi:hypothetical protein